MCFINYICVSKIIFDVLCLFFLCYILLNDVLLNVADIFLRLLAITLNNIWYASVKSGSNCPVGHHWPACETSFEWRFASGPMVARHCMLAGRELVPRF